MRQPAAIVAQPAAGPGRRRIVVLAHRTDLGARAVAERIGSPQVLVIRPEELARARWSHRIGPDGATSTELRLSDGRAVSSAAVGAILQRVRFLPAPPTRWRDRKDADYAVAEVSALVTSWLFSLRATVLGPYGLDFAAAAGMLRSRRALLLARECGLVITRSAVATTAGLIHRVDGATASLGPAELAEPSDGELRSTVVIGSAVYGAPTPEIAAGCRALAGRLSTSTLSVRHRAAGPYAVVEIDPLPALSEEWAIDATAAQLCGRAR